MHHFSYQALILHERFPVLLVSSILLWILFTCNGMNLNNRKCARCTTEITAMHSCVGQQHFRLISRKWSCTELPIELNATIVHGRDVRSFNPYRIVCIVDPRKMHLSPSVQRAHKINGIIITSTCLKWRTQSQYICFSFCLVLFCSFHHSSILS